MFIIRRGKVQPYTPCVRSTPFQCKMLALLIQTGSVPFAVSAYLQRIDIQMFANDTYLCYSELDLKICDTRPRRCQNWLVIAKFTLVFCQTGAGASQCDCGVQQRLAQIILFLFQVLLCLVAMHFTATSQTFEILCLFIISLLWEAVLLLSSATFVLKLTGWAG